MASSDPLSEMIQEALMEDVLPHLVSISYILDHTETKNLADMAKLIGPTGTVRVPEQQHEAVEDEIAANKFGPFSSPLCKVPGGLVHSPCLVLYVPRFGMSVSNQLLTTMLRTQGVSLMDILTRAKENLEDRTPGTLTRGLAAKYDRGRMPFDLNIMQPSPGSSSSSRFIAATFSNRDAHQSARIMVTDVQHEIASALGCPLAEVVFGVTVSQDATVPTPLFAARCDDMPAILAILEIVHSEDAHDLATEGDHPKGLECTPFMISSKADGSFDILPYPATAQQHATKFGSTTYMPWPHDDKQRQALLERVPPLILQAGTDIPQSRAAPAGLFPLRPDKQCFQCGKAGADAKCGKCRHAYFCGRACQVQNWGMHKAFCKKNRLLFGREEMTFDLEAVLADLQ